MTRQQALTKARAARAAKRAMITLELDRAQALWLYQRLEASTDSHGTAIRRALVERVLSP